MTRWFIQLPAFGTESDQLMKDELKFWFYNDQKNILLTLITAVISVIPGCIRLFIDSFGKPEFNYGLWFSLGQFLVSLVGLSLVALRYRPQALDNVADRLNLQDYIEECCNIKQTKIRDSASAYRVVRKTVNQFYLAWILVWLVWSIQYGLDIYLYAMDRSCISEYFNNLKYLLDFLSSSFMFAVYFILNDITVDISNRAETGYSNLYYAVVSCIFIFFIGLIFLMTHSANSYDSSFDKYELYTRILLSFFGTISFVFVLGKLNSNFLAVPRLLMILLYIYAISQSFAIFYSNDVCPHKFHHGSYMPIVEVVRLFMPWIISLGKIALLILLSWILYKRRLIFYIIHKSVLMTETPRMTREFNRYMNK